MRYTGNALKKDLLHGLTAASRLLPFALAVGVCAGMDVQFGMIAGLLCALTARRGAAEAAPTWMGVPFFIYTAGVLGSGGALTALALGGALAAIASLCGAARCRAWFSRPVYSTFLLVCAFCTTALQTTRYFGIGATGSTFSEMMRNYRSLGFHPNWRGILYGTIVMVVMITFPRKYKALFRRLGAGTVAIVLTTALNFFLNPVQASTAIDEVGAFEMFTWRTLGGVPARLIPLLCISALSFACLILSELWFVTDAAQYETKKYDLAAQGVLNTVSALFGGGAMTALYVRRLKTEPGAPEKERDPGVFGAVVSAAVCAIGLAAVFLCGKQLIERIPLPSLAVILIVYAWQGVPWGDIAAMLRGGLLGRLLFVLIPVAVLTLGPVYTLPLVLAAGTVWQRLPRRGA